MKIITLLSSENAVSEVVGFVTILGILVISIGIIGLAGYPMVLKAQETNYIENTKQSFIVVAENFNKVVLGQTPSQSVELKLFGGTLGVKSNSTINITANSTNITTGNITRIVLVSDQRMGSIESTIGNTVIAYEGTGVWTKYPNGNTLLISKPLIHNRSNVLVIPVVYVSGTSSVGGSGMSRITADGVPSVTFYNNVSDITVIITGDYTTGWENYFKSIMSWIICTSGECTAKLDASNIDIYILNIQLNTRII